MHRRTFVLSLLSVAIGADGARSAPDELAATVVVEPGAVRAPPAATEAQAPILAEAPSDWVRHRPRHRRVCRTVRDRWGRRVRRCRWVWV